MRKSDIVNLIKFHYERNMEGFDDQAFQIVKDFIRLGDVEIADYLQGIISSEHSFVPQSGQSNEGIFELINPILSNVLFFPDDLDRDIHGVINAISSNAGISKFLFSGKPGTGKTEAAKFITNALKRSLYQINFASLIDSRLGQTPKNVESLFAAIKNTYNLEDCLFLFDEIDTIALDRINSHDVREMGRTTSLFLKGLDRLPPEAIIMASTNLGEQLDPALKRRFDYCVDFDRYSKKDLADICIEFIKLYKRTPNDPGDFKLVKKCVEHTFQDLSPADIRNIVRIALAFSSPEDNKEYIRRIFVKLYSSEYLHDFQFMKETIGLSVREIETLAGVSKSSVAKRISEGGKK